MENKYKKSRYNYFVTIGKHVYCMNSISKNIYKLSFSILETYTKMKDEEIDLRIKSREEQVLCDNGLLVLQTMDEQALVEHLVNKEIYKDDMLFFMIIPTMNCNFDCVYCCQSNKNTIMDKSTQTHLLKFIQSEARKYKSISISWFGGEPLLAEEIVINIMECIKTNPRIRIPIIADMTTNGYLLTVDTFEKLIKHNILYYQITLDGNNDRHNKTRPLANGGDTFECIIKNLVAIKQQVKSQNFKIVIRINIDNTFSDCMNEFVDICAKNFNGDKRFVFYPKLIVDMGGEKVKKIKDGLITSTDIMYELACKLKERGLSVYSEWKKQALGWQCFASKDSSYVVNFDGKLYKCNNAIDDTVDIDVQFNNSIGDLHFHGNSNLDISKISKWLIRKNLPYKCIKCRIYPICLGEVCPLQYHFRKSRCMKELENIDYQIKIAVLNNEYEILN